MRTGMEAEMTRQERGQAIANHEGQVRRLDEFSYEVKSQSGNGDYAVLSTERGWLCSCPDHIYRDAKCKHIWAVEFSLLLREVVSSRTVIEPISVQACPRCESDKLVKHGIRHNRRGDLQRFTCRGCDFRFVINLGFEKMKASPQVITSAMQLYFTGESLRNVQKFLRLQGVNVSHVAVYQWIKKYVGLMKKYLEQVRPQVSDTWRADELYLKVKGDLKYLFALMDDETRFWIAQEVADTKYKHDARRLFQMGKEAAGKKPTKLITDGLYAYRDAFRKEFYSYRGARVEHIHSIRIRGDRNNNKMERLNGEIRDREKVVRGVKKKDTPILTGYQIYHNYMRPHEALNGRTPAQAAGIEVKGENKWLTLIQNASKKATSLRDS